MILRFFERETKNWTRDGGLLRMNIFIFYRAGKFNESCKVKLNFVGKIGTDITFDNI